MNEGMSVVLMQVCGFLAAPPEATTLRGLGGLTKLVKLDFHSVNWLRRGVGLEYACIVSFVTVFRCAIDYRYIEGAVII